MEPIERLREPARTDSAPGRTAALVYAVVLFLMLATGRTQLLRDPGIFWHVVVGRTILSRGELIHRDPFSFTFADEPWIAQQWLAECIMAAVHDVAGFTGLVWMASVIVAATFGLIAWRIARNGLAALPTLILCLLGAAAIAGHLHARPHLATIGLLALTWTWLRDVEDGRATLRRLWALVPLFVLWTNLHGGVLGGIATVDLACLGWIVWRLCGLPSPISSWSDLVRLGVCLGACHAAVLVNPYGTELPRTWFRLMQSDLSFISEHAPLNWGTTIGQLTLCLGVLYAATLLSVPCRELRPTWLLPIAWFVLGWSRVRHAPLFSVLSLLVVVDALPYSYWAPWLRGRNLLRTHAEPLPASVRSIVMPIALATTFPLILACVWRMSWKEEFWAAPAAEVWPADLLPAVQEFAAEHPIGTPIFNDMTYGGFLVYAAPKLRVFVDDRCELYGEEFLRSCLEAGHDPRHRREWLSRYDFEAALVEVGSLHDREFRRSPEWYEVARGTTAAFFIKR